MYPSNAGHVVGSCDERYLCLEEIAHIADDKEIEVGFVSGDENYWPFQFDLGVSNQLQQMLVDKNLTVRYFEKLTQSE